MTIRSYCSASVVLFVLVNCCLLAASPLECSSCGDECTQSCGTRHFRTCCFNYLRKRSDPPHRPAQIIAAAAASHSQSETDPPVGGHTTGGGADSAIALTRTEIVQLKRLLKLLPAELGATVQSVGRANRSPLMAVWLASMDPATGRSRAASAAPHTECYQLNDKHYCVETVSGNAVKWSEL